MQWGQVGASTWRSRRRSQWPAGGSSTVARLADGGGCWPGARRGRVEARSTKR